mmetsp:Transcript_6474/g.16558  ORF Transcript_6474/g.16558 Transcript_6474/m.16558 type:complete len:94 (+) Transcript_6474:88-369(+)
MRSSSDLFPAMSRAKMGVPTAAASSNAPDCPSDVDVFTTAAAALMYPTITARSTPGSRTTAALLLTAVFFSAHVFAVAGSELSASLAATAAAY